MTPLLFQYHLLITLRVVRKLLAIRADIYMLSQFLSSQFALTIAIEYIQLNKMENIAIVTNLDLFVILKSANKITDYQFLFESVLSRLDCNLSEEDRVTFWEFCRKFARAVNKRWRSVSRKADIFREKYESWLQTNIDWPSCILSQVQGTSIASVYEAEPSTSTSSVGTMTKRKHPRKAFDDLGTKQKKRRSGDLDGECSEMVFAAVSKLKADGSENMASVIEHMLKNPESIGKFQDVMVKQPFTKKIFTPQKALGLLLSLKLSKWQYITLRETAIREGIRNLYPSYYQVQKEKKECYPPENSITVTDSSAKITLQSLLDITAKRVLKSLPDNIKGKEMILVSKWGCDGASSQSRYKQKLDSADDDSSIFMTSLVPLKIMCEEKTVWENPKPCSPAFCRPVQFQFVKESEAVVKAEVTKMKKEISDLRPTEYETNKVTHDLIMTMVDAKICTYLSEAKSNAACYICLAKPTEMNNLELVEKRVTSPEMLKFGLSSLHARINVMGCLLNISYRLDIKKSSVRGTEEQNVRDAKKKIVQDRFKNELGLLIDVVKQGHGTTNDGNTARKFFEDPVKTADITGLDAELIHRFAVILQSITSGEDVDTVKFKDYAYKTAERYVSLYNWYYMSATVHKLLLHGADIITCNAIVPIGNLSEEASEARNKDFRRFREHNSRKKSRVSSNEDILNFLLLSSDPLISSIRPTFDAKKKKTFFSETLDLLKLQQPEFEFTDISHLDSDSEMDSDSDSDSE